MMSPCPLLHIPQRNLHGLLQVSFHLAIEFPQLVSYYSRLPCVNME
jgi:hypothetical protein